MASMNHHQKLKNQQKPARTNDDMMNEAGLSLKIHEPPSDQPHFHQPLIASIQTSSLNAHSLSLSPCKLE
jgi:predicted metalloenzyme YecM